MKELTQEEMSNISGGGMGAVTELGATIAAVREIWHLAGNKHVINAEKRVSHEVAEKVKHVYHEVKEHFNHHDK